MLLNSNDFLIVAKFVKFGRFDSKHYQCELLSGKWPTFEDLITYCDNNAVDLYQRHGGGKVTIKGSKAKVIVYMG